VELHKNKLFDILFKGGKYAYYIYGGLEHNCARCSGDVAWGTEWIVKSISIELYICDNCVQDPGAL